VTASGKPGPPEDRRTEPSHPADVGHRLRAEAGALDRAVYDAVATTPTPTLDGPMAWLSNAANYSGIWLVTAGVLALVGGRAGRAAAFRGLIAVGVTSATANLVAKRLLPRRRPNRPDNTTRRGAPMPGSGSFPSGHTASAFAFATAVSADLPMLTLPLFGLASAVGYSRVHNGVHYPGDVMGGAVLGLSIGTAVSAMRPRRASGRP
jgi:undecaprenyl-diphosphatase